MDQTKSQLVKQANIYYDESKRLFEKSFEDFNVKMEFILKQYDYQNKSLNKMPNIYSNNGN